MDKVGIGVLSHAHGHVTSCCRVMQNLDDVDLVANWDDDENRGGEIAKSMGMEFRSSPQEVVNDPRVHAVMIGSETNRHAEHVDIAASAGKHILLEKPMATTLEDCDRIIASVSKAGIMFSMAFQMRLDPVNQKIRELVNEGVVGKIAVVRRRHCIPALLNPNFATGPNKWHVDPIANVGMFFDDAIHAADWFYWILGEPTSVTAEIDSIVTDTAPDDNGVAIYRFKDGIIGTLFNGSTTVAGVNTTEIYGDQGTIIQDYGDAPSTSAPRPADAVPLKMIRSGDDKWTEYNLDIPAGQGVRIEAVARPFVDYLRGLTDLTVSAEEGRVSVEMVLGAYRSSAEGCRTHFPLRG